MREDGTSDALVKSSGLEPQSSQSGSTDGHRRSSSPVRPSSDYTAAGVLKSEAMKATHQAWADGQVTTSSCAFCDWTHEGPAGEGREAARAV